ncbi:unnamed protein product [Onchocerca flexuosa]|uniref:Uncharacterized protein n=1 Tax=Onchocerca flexuosa TaxID=387005 RepID=A0A183I2G1_9BILA|nr:unnamed protein product [Onchocerca flexuosa]
MLQKNEKHLCAVVIAVVTTVVATLAYYCYKEGKWPFEKLPPSVPDHQNGANAARQLKELMFNESIKQLV